LGEIVPESLGKGRGTGVIIGMKARNYPHSREMWISLCKADLPKAPGTMMGNEKDWKDYLQGLRQISQDSLRGAREEYEEDRKIMNQKPGNEELHSRLER
jgi:hypothetical protein